MLNVPIFRSLGPPGTGKTLLARLLAARASQFNITFFSRKASDFLERLYGETERKIRLMFQVAREQAPSIIFFDEIDALAPARSPKQEQIHNSVVATLLSLMDGVSSSK